MMQLSYRLYLLATALNYQLPRRLTRGGLLAGTGMILAGVIGSDMEQSMAFQAFALTLCLLLVAWLWAPFFRGRFTVQRALPRLATVDQPFRYRVAVRNTSSRHYEGLEILEDLADPRPSFKEFAQVMRPRERLKTFRLGPGARARFDHRLAVTKPVALPQLRPSATAETQVEVVPLRRGPLRFAGVTVARRDPLGLVRGFVRLPLPQTVLVLPKRHRVPPLALANHANHQPGGVSLASSIGESEEFVSLRDYRPGDAVRRIHWRSWARAGRPIVKEYQEEYFIRQGLVLDTFVPATRRETFEEAVSVAASFACTLETQESLLDLLFIGAQAFCFTTGRGLGGSQQVLEVLASVQPSQETAFDALITLVLRHRPLLSGCICVLMAWDEPRQDLVRQLHASGLPILTVVIASDAERKAILLRSPAAMSQVHFLQPGRIAEGLLGLEGGPR